MSNQRASKESLSPSMTPDPTPWIPYDHVWIMHLSSDASQVMMCESEGDWHFPYFFCRKSAHVILHQCCHDYQQSLQIQSEQPCFTLLCELMGNQYTSGTAAYGPRRAGKLQLLWVEQHIPSFQLPDNHAWKDVSFVQTLKCHEQIDASFKLVVDRVITALVCAGPVVNSDEVRYQMGWHSNACKWLHHVAERDGAQVVENARQYRVCFTSTTLVLNTSKGSYFLKAPLAGSGEVTKTCAIANVMPDDTLDVVSKSEELGAFVSRGFKTFYEKTTEQGGEKYTSARAVLKALASFQMRSIECRDRLIAAGVPIRDLQTINAELRSMKEDDDFATEMQAGYPMLAAGLPHLEESFAKLNEFNIPMVLTHGDYGKRNFGFKNRTDGRDRMILFDWQFACISHPFLEFYDICSMFGESEEELDRHMDEYLGMWIDFEPLSRAREAFALAEPVGWLLRAVSNLELQRAGFQVEVEPPLDTFAFEDLWTALNKITPKEDLKKAMMEYRESRELAGSVKEKQSRQRD